MATTLSLKSDIMTWKLGFPLQLPVHRMPPTTSCSMKVDQFRCAIRCLFSQKPLQSMGRRGDSSIPLQSSSLSRGYYLVPSKSAPDDFFSTPFHSPPPFDFGSDEIFVWQTFEFAMLMLFLEVLSYGFEGNLITTTEKTTVLKVQVGLLGTDHSLQRNLNRIAEVANTSTAEGLSSLLAETILALLQYPNYFISAYSSVDIKQGIKDAEKLFNQLSNEEQGKISKKTLVNWINILKQSKRSRRADESDHKYIVVTILAAAEGVHKLPTIKNRRDLKEALQKLGSIPSSKILAVEVFWTPKNENETLTGRELLEDYSLLRPL